MDLLYIFKIKKLIQNIFKRSFCNEKSLFPDPNDRTKNDPATIVSSKQVIGIYNQLNKDGNEIQRITSDIKDWFVKEAIDNYGWDESKFIGNQCILENKFKNKY